jgi:hypothetical protein
MPPSLSQKSTLLYHLIQQIILPNLHYCDETNGKLYFIYVAMFETKFHRTACAIYKIGRPIRDITLDIYLCP